MNAVVSHYAERPDPEPDRANLAETRLSEPERLGDSVFGRRTAFVLTGLSHERCCVALRRTSRSAARPRESRRNPALGARTPGRLCLRAPYGLRVDGPLS